MSFSQIEIQFIAIFISIACSLLGVFLVLRKMVLISDAISHSILPGIVLGYFITEDLNSPILILMAAIVGILTVGLVEWIYRTGLVKEDTSIGLVFPGLFSLGIIMITQNASDVHLDTDAVLLGELAFAPFDRIFIDGIDYGAKALYKSIALFVVISSAIFLFYKELKLSTFDEILAKSMGFTPFLIYFLLMLFSSITIVGAFDIIGAILVVGFMTIPAASAYLLTTDLKWMLIYSAIIASISSVGGYWLAHILDASIAGCIMMILGLLFTIVYLFSPQEGQLFIWKRRKKQKEELDILTLLLHLKNHLDENERNIYHLEEDINWTKVKASRIVTLAKSDNLVQIDKDILSLTEDGKLLIDKKLKLILPQM